MRDTTKAFLDRLRTADLFSRIGTALADADVIDAEGWRQAAQIADSRQNDNLRLQAKNALRALIPYPEFNATWNSRVDEIKPFIHRCVEAAAVAAGCPPEVQDSIVSTARYDLTGAALEIEYAEYDREKFYRSFIEWYFRGHFVCGWDCSQGYFRLIVF